MEADVEPAQRLDPAKLPRKDDIYQDYEWMVQLSAMDPDELGEKLDKGVE